MSEEAKKILESTLPFTSELEESDREKLIAASFRELISQYGYTHWLLDGDHGMRVVNERDVLRIVEELEGSVSDSEEDINRK